MACSADIHQSSSFLQQNLATIHASIPTEDLIIVPWQSPEVLPVPFKNIVTHKGPSEHKLPYNVYERQTAHNLSYSVRERSLLAAYRRIAADIVQMFAENGTDTANSNAVSPLPFAIVMHSDVKMEPEFTTVPHSLAELVLRIDWGDFQKVLIAVRNIEPMGLFENYFTHKSTISLCKLCTRYTRVNIHTWFTVFAQHSAY